MISVIIPVYNTESYLRRCIDSVLGSVYQDFELLLVDDGSRDNSLQLCREYSVGDNRVKVIAQEHRGVSAARNRGISESRGEWIIFVDSDDFISCDFFSIVIQKKYEDQDLLIFDFAGSDKKELQKKKEDRKREISDTQYIENENLYLVEKLLRSQQLEKNGRTDLRSPWAKAYRRRVIEQYSVCFPTELSMGEDQIFQIEYQMRTKCCTYIRRPVYFVETRPDSVTQCFQEDLLEQYQVFEERLKSVLEKHGCYTLLEEAYYDTVLSNMKGILVMSIFHPDSFRADRDTYGLCQRMQEDRRFREAVEMHNGKTGDITRRILIFCFRFRWYGIVKLICRAGHIHMRWRKR